MAASPIAPIDGEHTTLTLDATEFARFLEHMASFAEVAAHDDTATTYTRTYSEACGHTYRLVLGTLFRMVESPDESPFVVAS